MSIEITSNIDEELQKAERLLNVYSQIKNIQEAEDYLTAEDIAKIMNCTIVSARDYMNRPDFPLIKCGKGFKVNRMAFFLYNLSRRIKWTKIKKSLYKRSNLYTRTNHRQED